MGSHVDQEEEPEEEERRKRGGGGEETVEVLKRAREFEIKRVRARKQASQRGQEGTREQDGKGARGQERASE